MGRRHRRHSQKSASQGSLPGCPFTYFPIIWSPSSGVITLSQNGCVTNLNTFIQYSNFFLGQYIVVSPPFITLLSGLDNEIGAVCKTRTCLGEEWNQEINACSAELFTIRGVGKSCGSPIKQYDAVVLSTNERNGVVAKGKSEHIVSGSSLPSLNYTFYWKIHVDL